MPSGAMRSRLRRVIAGLLVLTALLFSGAQASLPIVPNPHQDTDMAGQITVAANQGLLAPTPDHDDEHGLPCCVGDQCTTHAYWILAETANLPNVSQIGVVSLLSGEAAPRGVATRPSPPPPRAVG